MYGIKYEYFPSVIYNNLRVEQTVFFNSRDNMYRYKSKLLDRDVNILKEGRADFADNGRLVIL